MNGHQPLIALRRRGLRPSAVWFTVDLGEPLASDWHEQSAMAHIGVSSTESIAALDLRCVVGLVVMVSGNDRRRCVALHNACIEAGASRVVTHVHRPNKHGEAETFLQMVHHETTFEAA